MRTIWEINGGEKLLLIFSGWAMDERPTSILQLSGYDKCTCYEYTSLSGLDLKRVGGYKEICLIAWSTGVWVAEQVIGLSGLQLTKAVAINGTPTTIHDLTGIPRALFQATFDHLSSKSFEKFTRRMMGNAAEYTLFISIAPNRELDNQKQELEHLLRVSFEEMDCGLIKWDKAIISTNDAIFPSKNQKNYWIGKTTIEEVELGHYPFFSFNMEVLL